MTKQLKRQFFERSALVVARELLGKYLVRKLNGRLISVRITETEAYHGPKDLASHASKGKTLRTAVMFGPPGYSYIYLVYGMYHCFNIVTDKENFPAAVLIRAAEIRSTKSARPRPSRGEAGEIRKKLKIKNSKLKILAGPGILCRELRIDKKLNGVDLTHRTVLWVEDRGEKVGKVKRMPRIGVDYAKEYKDKLWRFCIGK